MINRHGITKTNQPRPIMQRSYHKNAGLKNAKHVYCCMVWLSEIHYILIVLLQVATCYQTNCHSTAILTWSDSDVKIQQSFIMPFTNKLRGKWDGAIIQNIPVFIYLYFWNNAYWHKYKLGCSKISINITPKVYKVF